MTTRKLLIVILILITLLFCIGTVNATEVTMNVDSKHIIGMGSGNTPFDIDSFVNVVYVLSEREMNSGTDKYIRQEYPVSLEDYCKVEIGKKVTLEVPDSRLDVCKVVKIE